MGAEQRITPAAVIAPRREEALAIIVERIARSMNSPTYAEIGQAMVPPVGKTRVRQLVDQLVGLRVIDRDPGSNRGIRILDIVRCRAMIEDALGMAGWWHARPLGPIEAPTPCTIEQLAMMPAFEHLPDVD
ncbi:MAG TPA: hypothetical protein VF638_05515 [Sphingomonas sp.]|jgi:SOS-response transcriptional repressor LexA